MILVSIVCICAQCHTVEHAMVEKHAVPNEVIVDLPEDWAYENGVHLCPDCRIPGWRPPSEPPPSWAQSTIQEMQQNLERDCPLTKLTNNPPQGETIHVQPPAPSTTTKESHEHP